MRVISKIRSTSTGKPVFIGILCRRFVVGDTNGLDSKIRPGEDDEP